MFGYTIKPGALFLVCITFLQCSTTKKISDSVRISAGAINGVFIEKNGNNLVVYGDPKDEIKKGEMVLHTHFRRDVVWAARNLVQKGSLAVVPAGEKSFFTRRDSIWEKFAVTRFHDYDNQTTKIGILPLKDCRFVR